MKLSEWLNGRTNFGLITRGMAGVRYRGIVAVDGFMADADAESDPELATSEDGSVSFSNGFIRFYLSAT